MLNAWTLAIATMLAAQADVPRTAWVEADAVDVSTSPTTPGSPRDASRGPSRDDPPRRPGRLGDDRAAGRVVQLHRGIRHRGPGGRPRTGDRPVRLRPSRPRGARMPGPPRVTLEARDDRPPARPSSPGHPPTKGGRATWIAIAPPRAEVRFVRADALGEGLEPDDPDDPPRRDSLASTQRPAPATRPSRSGPADAARIGPIDRSFASTGPSSRGGSLSRGEPTRSRRISARHAQILRQPIERWDLAPIQKAYTSLFLRGMTDATDRRAVEPALIESDVRSPPRQPRRP